MIQLASADKFTCMLGKKKLYATQFRCSFAWLSDKSIPIRICKQTLKCEAVRQQMLGELEDAYPRIQALDCWRHQWNGKLCLTCEAAAKRHHQMGRECVWAIA